MKQVLILLIIVLGLAVGDVNPTPQKHRLGNIKNSKIADGCGCYFQFPNSQRNSEKYMFFSSIEGSEEREAWINLDGKDTKLKLVSKTDPKARERVGSRSTRRYVAAGVLVEAVYVATRVCKVNDENCESTDYVATFNITIGTYRQVVKAVGGCGC